MFVTSTTYNGCMGGLAGADGDCQARATATGLTGTFKAWLSTNSVSAASRLTHSTVPYVLLNGTVVANSWTDLTSGTLRAPIDVTELGATVSGAAWTDTLPNGNANTADFDCTGWTSCSSACTCVQFWGASSLTDCEWTEKGIANSGCATPGVASCSNIVSLYCFEQ